MTFLSTDHLRLVRSQMKSHKQATESRSSLLTASSFPKEQICIKLEAGRTFYTNLDMIAGSIEYSAALNFQSTVLTVELLGVTQLTKSVWGGHEYKDVSVEWPFLRRTSQIDIDMELGKSPFSIQVPTLMQPRQCPVGNHLHLTLPPTAGSCSRFDGLDDLMENAKVTQVTYLIRAELRCLDENKSLGHVSERFHFIPQTSLLRSVMVEEIEESDVDYTEAVQDIFKLSQGSLTLSLNRNATIYTTATQISLTSPLQTSLRFEGSSPPDLAKVSFRLLSTTIRRTKHQHEENAGFSEPAPFVARDLMAVEFTSKTPRWDASRTELHVWTMKHILPITLMDDQKSVCLPSFESCLLSRRYKIRMTIGLSSTSSFRPLRPVQYTFPINVETDLRRARLKHHPDVDSGPQESEAVPSYDETEAAFSYTAPIMRVPQYIDIVPDLERLRRPSWYCKAETAPGSIRGSSISTPTTS